VKSGLVEHPIDWIHSSYAQLECIVRQIAFEYDDVVMFYHIGG
jgi:hypothetical protein